MLRTLASHHLPVDFSAMRRPGGCYHRHVELRQIPSLPWWKHLNLWPRVEQRKWMLAKIKKIKQKQKQNHQKNKSTGRNRKKKKKTRKKQKKLRKMQVLIFFVFFIFFVLFLFFPWFWFSSLLFLFALVLIFFCFFIFFVKPYILCVVGLINLNSCLTRMILQRHFPESCSKIICLSISSQTPLITNSTVWGFSLEFIESFSRGKKLDPKRKTDPKNERKAQTNQTENIF